MEIESRYKIKGKIPTGYGNRMFVFLYSSRYCEIKRELVSSVYAKRDIVHAVLWSGHFSVVRGDKMPSHEFRLDLNLNRVSVKHA